MRGSRFTEARIIGMIKGQGAGMPTAEVWRRHGLSPASFYNFKAKYGGMNVSDTHRLKTLEHENAQLKRLLAGTILDNVVLKYLLEKTDETKCAMGCLLARGYWIMTSRNAERASFLVSIPRPSGATKPPDLIY